MNLIFNLVRVTFTPLCPEDKGCGALLRDFHRSCHKNYLAAKSLSKMVSTPDDQERSKKLFKEIPTNRLAKVVKLKTTATNGIHDRSIVHHLYKMI